MPNNQELSRALANIMRLSNYQAAQAAQLMMDLSTIQRGVKAAQAGLPEAFHFDVVRPMSRIIDDILLAALPSFPPPAEKNAGPQLEDARFLYSHCPFIQGHLRQQFVLHEGERHSADKARAVLMALARHLVTGAPIAFDYTAESTAHLPTTILKTEAAIVAFFRSLQALYGGQAEPYLQATADITAQAEALRPAPTEPPQALKTYTFYWRPKGLLDWADQGVDACNPAQAIDVFALYLTEVEGVPTADVDVAEHFFRGGVGRDGGVFSLRQMVSPFSVITCGPLQ